MLARKRIQHTSSVAMYCSYSLCSTSASYRARRAKRSSGAYDLLLFFSSPLLRAKWVSVYRWMSDRMAVVAIASEWMLVYYSLGRCLCIVAVRLHFVRLRFVGGSVAHIFCCCVFFSFPSSDVSAYAWVSDASNEQHLLGDMKVYAFKRVLHLFVHKNVLKMFYDHISFEISLIEIFHQF